MTFRKLLAIFMNYTHNIKILHWKATGKLFDEYHELLDSYYEKMQEDIDLIAELGLIHGENPLGLAESFELLKEDKENYKILDPNDDYDEKDIIDNIDVLFKDILKAIEELLKEDKVDQNPGTRSELENLYAYYDKECNYKNKRRKK